MIAERFEIERLIASGGMGHVYRAVDRLSGDRVALKVLHGSAARRPVRFEREIQALAELRHPAIVRYVASGVTGTGAPFLVMEWLEGVTLSERLREGPLSIAEACALGSALAAALAVVHEHGFIHRDLKPSNIFLVGGAVSVVT